LVILASAWVNLGNTWMVSAFVPLALGGVLAHYKPWLPTEDDIRNRVNQRRQTLVEGTCKSLHRVLTQVLSIPGASQLRGAPPNEPDIVGDYIADMFRTFAVIRELDLIQSGVKRCYTTFFITAVIGLIGALIAWPFESARPYVALVCYAVILTQVYCVGLVRRMAKQLEVYEQTT
jgi:hypothetical protein